MKGGNICAPVHSGRSPNLPDFIFIANILVIVTVNILVTILAIIIYANILVIIIPNILVIILMKCPGTRRA